MSINYTNYSNMNEFKTDENDEIDDIQTDELDIPYEEVEENKEVIMGKIVNCKRVYIRENPSVQSNPLTDIPSGKEILIMDKSKDWYNVCTESGVEGYIMEDFVETV